jgi:hypothetical protein
LHLSIKEIKFTNQNKQNRQFFLFSIRHVLRSSSDFLRHSLIALLGSCVTPNIFHKLTRIRLDAGKNRLEAERAGFLEEESEAGNRVGFDLLGQNQRVFEAFGLILPRSPALPDSLELRIVKAG